MDLAVIGAGFGRTGTLSLKLALERLGFGPCCHTSDEHHFIQGLDFWSRIFNHEPIDWDEFFQGYRATVDSPSCRLYLELADRYPNAKVVLTWRESNSWFASYAQTILPMISAATHRKYLSFLFGSETCDRDCIIAAYERHNAEVQRLIPAERLLVYEVRQGWDPLCGFLDVAVPDTPFPNSNPRVGFSPLIADMLTRLEGSSANLP
jgi:hypothetical protein